MLTTIIWKKWKWCFVETNSIRKWMWCLADTNSLRTRKWCFVETNRRRRCLSRQWKWNTTLTTVKGTAHCFLFCKSCSRQSSSRRAKESTIQYLEEELLERMISETYLSQARLVTTSPACKEKIEKLFSKKHCFLVSPEWQGWREVQEWQRREQFLEEVEREPAISVCFSAPPALSGLDRFAESSRVGGSGQTTSWQCWAEKVTDKDLLFITVTTIMPSFVLISLQYCFFWTNY